MTKSNRFKKVVSQRGDTIVEVLMSVAILSVVLVAGYVTASHSLRVGQASDQRAQALSAAQGQVEQLINAQNTGRIDTYKSLQPYCIHTDNTTTPADATTKVCNSFEGKPFGIGVSYEPTTGVFTVLSTWISQSSNTTQDQLKLYYKLPGSY